VVTWETSKFIKNSDWRKNFLEEALKSLRLEFNEPTLLDVGAGQAPYEGLCRDLGYKYRAHDFAQYRPDPGEAGLKEECWTYREIDFISDINDLPAVARSNVILCTDVLEHVPDPAKALESMVSILTPGGYIVIVVPLNSIIHQAPFFFQPGLSPYFFDYHLRQKLNLQITSMRMVGDYIDFVIEEIQRAFDFYEGGQGFFRKVASWLSVRIFGGITTRSLLLIRKFSSHTRLAASSKGVCVVAKRVD
jgi:SAM-dependent methyltransferase